MEFHGAGNTVEPQHAQAVYVPAECRLEPARCCRYGSRVRMSEGTDS